ncbi:O-antigen ligase family protein [Micromonospora sp. NPDC004551]|uniref:O-antigen ligase family protein n=1 Tax=Micromonospora sp. NPDC004551 TaxID=3154284 RepID=UPI0033A63D6A
MTQLRWQPTTPVGQWRPEHDALSPTRRPAMSVTLLTGLFLVALAGRITPDRAGISIGVDDLRRPACAVLLTAALIWQAEQWARGTARPWPRFFHAFTALIAVQILSALWAPWGARVETAVWDLVLLWVIVLLAATFTAGDPRRAARTVLVLMLAAGLIYAVAGLHAGPQLQGRVSAFGGGPNVYVRVVSLAAIAAVTLAVATRRWWLLLPVPVLGAAAVLSGSRGGLVALVGAATAFFVFFLRRRRTTVLAATLLLGGAAGWAVWQVMGASFVTLAATRYNAGMLEANGYSERPELLSIAWQMFREHPVAGAGMDAFNAATGMGYPHNLLAGLAAEAGILGVGLLLLVIYQWCRDGRPWSVVPPEQVGCAVGAVYVLLASMFSGDYYDTRFCWILAVVAVARTRPRPRRWPTGERLAWPGEDRRADVGHLVRRGGRGGGRVRPGR